jgi:orotate phosphoribosyltransferase-like protein
MRDLTMYELDAQLAEQLPTRELMQATAVAIGAIAVNLAHVDQANVVDHSTVSGSVTQSNTSTITQTATATNSGPVSAAAVVTPAPMG